MKTIIILLSMLFCTTHFFAQTNYYTETKTFFENGFTYQCDLSVSKWATLYNKSNKLTYTDQIIKSTGEHFIRPDDVDFQMIEPGWPRYKLISIVNNAFSTAEKQRVNERKFYIIMYINPDTGKVNEVNFEFTNFGPYATIPISVFRKIELEVKSNIWFTPTANGKKLNYIYYNWGSTPQ